MNTIKEFYCTDCGHKEPADTLGVPAQCPKCDGTDVGWNMSAERMGLVALVDTFDDEDIPPMVRISLDGIPLTPEESEAAAGLVACMRRGWWLGPRAWKSLLSNDKYSGFAVFSERGAEIGHGSTPTLAYNAARAAEGEE